MKSILVIGNGMVGYKFCEKFVAKKTSENFKITVFGEEPRPAYDRVHLSEFFENGDAKALEMAPRSWYEENNIELITNERVTDIHRASKTITTINEKTFSYDYLVLATGSSAFVPSIKGVEKDQSRSKSCGFRWWTFRFRSCKSSNGYGFRTSRC